MTTAKKATTASRILAGLAGVSLLTGLGLAAAGYLLAQGVWGGPAARDSLLAAAVVVAGGLLALVPVGLSLGGPPAQLVAAAMGNLAVRFVGTLGLALLVRPLAADGRFFLIWVAAVQFVLLMVDMAALARAMRGRLGPRVDA